MILDSITHLTPDGRWFETDYDATWLRLSEDMAKAGVDRAIVVALAGNISNEFVKQICQEHPGQLVPGASFNPVSFTNEKEAVLAFKRELKDKSFKLLKLHPRLNKFDPLDRRCMAILSELSTWSTPLPIWLDSLLVASDLHLSKSPLQTIHDLVTSFPKLTFVLLHSAGSQALLLAETVRDCQNVFLDLSFVLHRYRGSSVELDLRFLIEQFDRRLVWGSDFPEVALDTALSEFKNISKGIAQDKIQNILGNNLVKILGLEKELIEKS